MNLDHEAVNAGSVISKDANTVLCVANSYDKKYYLNPIFERLPEDIRNELKVISVLFTEEIGGYFMMEFTPDGSLEFRTEARDSDYNFDEIGAALMVKEIRKTRSDLLMKLELYYKAAILKMPLEEI